MMAADYSEYGALRLKSGANPPPPSYLTWRFNCAIMCHGVALVVLLTTVIVNYWVSGVVMGHDVNIGLWRACLDGTCVSLFEYNSQLLQVIGFNIVCVQIIAILALGTSFLSFLCALVCLIFSGTLNRDKQLPGLCVLKLVTGALTSLAALIFYMTVYRHLASTGDADYLAPTTAGWLIGSSLLSILAAVLYILEHSWSTQVISHYEFEYRPLKK